MRRLPLLIIFISAVLNAQSLDLSAEAGYKSIKASDLKSYLYILASDSLEGRETTYPGQKKAAKYIAEHFKKLKLEAIGDSGTYFQHFEVEHSRVNPETRIITDIDGNKKQYNWEEDFISESARDTTVTGPAAFIGFTDTELDSVSQSRIEGRIIFVFIGKRDNVNDTTLTSTLRRLYGIRREKKAAAALMITDPEGPASYQRALQMIQKYDWNKGTMKLNENQPDEKYPYVKFLISPEMAENVLKTTGRSLKQVKEEAIQNQNFSPVFIDNVTLTIESKIIKEIKITENVAGLLRGSDPQLNNQVVAITAHYDHIGKSKSGVIYPGADDNGSGTATVLELADAFVKNRVRPKRSLLFMTVAGEEKGLLGSKYYIKKPIIPLDLTVADINIDMIGRIDSTHENQSDTNYIYVIGANKISTELDSLLNTANKESENLVLDYHYDDENDPEQLYRRSDHFNFAKNGIPVVFFFDGIHKDYHKPTDTADRILYDRMAKVTRLIYDLGWKLGNIGRPLTKKSDY